MATTTKKVTGTGGVYQATTAGLSVTETAAAGANTYIVSADQTSAKLSLTGTGDKIVLNGSSYDYKVSVSNNTVTLKSADQTVTVTVPKATKTASITDSLYFLDGKLDLVRTTSGFKLGDQSVTGSAKDVTATVADSTLALDHFSGVSPIAGSSDTSGQTFTLTASMDNLTGTAGNDTFIGGSAEINAADVITGGAGTDTANLFLDVNNQTKSLTATGVEVFNINASGTGVTFNGANITGATEVWSKGSSATLNLTGFTADQTFGAASNGANVVDVALKAGAGSAATLNLAVNAAGTSTATSDIRVHAGAAADKATSMTLAAVAGSSNIAIANYSIDGSGASIVDTNNLLSGLKTLTITGAGSVKVANAALIGETSGGSGGQASTALDNLTTIDAAGNTGGVTVNLSANTKDIKFTGGTGNDNLIVLGSSLSNLDSIDLGAGTNTLTVAVANATTSTVLTSSATDPVKAINASKGVNIVGAWGNGTTIGATAATGNGAGNAALSIDASKFTTATGFEAFFEVQGGAGGATDGSASAGGDGGAGINLSSANTTTLTLDGNVTGGAGGAGSGAGANEAAGNGGAGIYIRPVADSGSDAITLTFNKASTVKGGAGGNVTGGTDGKLGFGLDALNVETLTINTANADADVTFAIGTGSGVSTGISDVRVGANANITLKGAGDINLGNLISNDNTTNNAMTINAADMSGKLTVYAGAGNDKITGGSGADVIRGGVGADVIDGGAGKDTFLIAGKGSSSIESGTVASSKIATMDTYNNVVFGGNDVFKIGATLTNPGAAATVVTIDTNTQSLVTAATDLTAAADLLLKGVLQAQNSVATFTYSGTSYLLFSGDSTTTNGFTEGQDVIVKLVGATGTLATGDVLYV